jgi:hypothetical protein
MTKSCINKRINLGYLEEAHESLQETAIGIPRVLNTIEENEGIKDEKRYNLVYLLSSRGSIPFVKGLTHLHRSEERRRINTAFEEDQLSDKKRNHNKRENSFRMVPHIFSIENLLEIISNNDQLRYICYKDIVDYLYEDIADTFNKKIYAALSHDKKNLITDWDEIITGRNISERIKIYNRLKLGTIPFYITSFLSEKKKRLEKESVYYFKRHFRKSPENFSTINVLLENPVSWSDNEQLYGDMGIRYPMIAVPPINKIRNMIKAKGLPEFYLSFFSNYSMLFSKDRTKNMMYRLVIDDPVFTYDEKETLQNSFEAYIRTIKTLNPDAFKENKTPEYRYSIEYDAGKVLRHSPSSITPVLELRNERSGNCYSNPFLLYTREKNQDSEELSRLINEFIKRVEEQKTDKELIKHNKVF